MRQLSTAVVGVLVVGLIVGGYVSGRSSAQAVSRAIPPMTWPPPPQLMVDTQGTATVAGFASTDVLLVPSDRWFVLTDVSMPALAYDAGLFQLGEEASGTFTPRLDLNKGQWSTDAFTLGGNVGLATIRFQSATGIAFRPGSKVRLLNLNAAQRNVCWSIVGYFAPK